MNIHELIGKQVVEIEHLREMNQRLLKLVKELKAGTASLDDVHIEGSPVEELVPVRASSNGVVSEGNSRGSHSSPDS